ncbi:UPF0280 family protein [uncultured Roseobacter sp.]|uniref:UPF0280 family protein n=1 Tax=uncultured Roseobacter sp. TaxID=114847 RepID=UPI00261C1626|nr:UPF0280 family protein [uncultured Roseobacter sp.]
MNHTGPTANILPCGQRLHLQHGPIDLVIGADGQRQRAFEAAVARFSTVLAELVEELPALRTPLGARTPRPTGEVARRMHAAALPFRPSGFLTRMAAVAGAVADEILAAMCAAAVLERAYVNNGGDIALHLTGAATFTTAMTDHRGQMLGRITLTARDGVGGIATSGRHGRSHSLGIADSVTVLARTAATADVAATLVANAVDLPGHPAITRRAASALDENADLGDRPVVTGCGALAAPDCHCALARGKDRAAGFTKAPLIHSAALFLQEHACVTDHNAFALHHPEDAYA